MPIHVPEELMQSWRKVFLKGDYLLIMKAYKKAHRKSKLQMGAITAIMKHGEFSNEQLFKVVVKFYQDRNKGISDTVPVVKKIKPKPEAKQPVKKTIHVKKIAPVRKPVKKAAPAKKVAASSFLEQRRNKMLGR